VLRMTLAEMVLLDAVLDEHEILYGNPRAPKPRGVVYASKLVKRMGGPSDDVIHDCRIRDWR
jgi:hypothetical protein